VQGQLSPELQGPVPGDLMAIVQAMAPEINTESPVPRYHQIAEALSKVIQSWPDGSRLPGEIELANSLNVSRATIKRAFEQLLRDGLLYRKQGLGTFTAPRRLPRALKLTSLWEDLTNAGRLVTTQVLNCHIVPADPLVAERLEVAEGTDVVFVERLRLADGRPFALMKNWHPLPACEPLLHVDFSRASLYAALERECGVVLQVAKQTIQARLPSPAEARLLSLSRREPVLQMKRQAFVASGQPVEWGNHIYPADQCEFSTVLER